MGISDVIHCADRWRSNADMIANGVGPLWYSPGDIVVDATYGEGKFWSLWEPDGLIKHDKFKLDGVDFRLLPEENNSVDIVVLDPAFISVGGRDTSQLDDMNDRYGMLTSEEDPQANYEVTIHGVSEARRVLKRHGLLWWKGMDYVSSGRKHWFSHRSYNDLTDLGFILEDQFHLVTNGGPQPHQVQVHSWSNISYLLIARKT